MTPNEAMKRYPHIVAHIICHSLGYATPRCAAQILADHINGRPNFCEWIACCYHGVPKGAVEGAIRGRHSHKGFMARFSHALALVRQAIEQNREPIFASWM